MAQSNRPFSFPLHCGAVNGIAIHFETYLRNLQDDYNKFNDGYTGTFHLNRMTPFCRKNFLLDPHSPYKTVAIGTETTDLHLDGVLLTIGVSRVFQSL
jgi:hypothetical protein